MRWPPRVDGERGSAILEFHFLGLLLLIPLVYVMLSVLDVQRAAFGTTQAAREAGRMFAVTGDEAAARHAAAIALRDQGLDPTEVDVRLSCPAAPCYRPGAEVTVDVRTSVTLPMVPDALAGAINTEIPVSATYVNVIDRYRELP